MSKLPRRWLIAGLAPVTFAVAPLAFCSEPAPAPAPSAPIAIAAAPAAAALAGPLTLATCRQIALARQPAVRAAQDSLAAAVARNEGVEGIRVPTLLQPDLPIRRRQSQLGVQVAQAGVSQAEAEAVYAATRNYFSILYARQQQAVATEALRNLNDLKKAIKQVMAQRRDVSERHVEKVDLYLKIVEERSVEAVEGEKRALAALREALGLAPDCPLQVAGDRLPAPDSLPGREEFIQLTLTRRGEMTQATLAAELTCLEVKAQDASRHARVPTFASASDIHAQQVPGAVHNNEYRPGGLALEMPTTLVGSRAHRVEQAQALHARAETVVEKTRNLLVLEAENSYFRAAEERNRLAKLRTTIADAEKYQKNIQTDFGIEGSKTPPDDLLNAGVLLTQVRLQLNEAQYNYLLALAALERITAGGFCPAYEK